jgi:hypothetical protein
MGQDKHSVNCFHILEIVDRYRAAIDAYLHRSSHENKKIISQRETVPQRYACFAYILQYIAVCG